jgi:hypothetical protein
MGKSRYSNTNVNNEILRDSPENGAVSSSFSATTISATTFYGNLIDNQVLTTGVTVTAAEFIAAGAPNGQIVKQILPAAGAGKYYEIDKCIVKFKNATVAYDQFPACGLRTSSGSNYKGGSSSITLPAGTDEQILAYFIGSSPEINGDLTLSYISNFGSAITAGDGDLIFEIEYKILDF